MEVVLDKVPETLTATAPVASPTWRPATRVAFRFCATYFTLYILSTQMLGSLLPLPLPNFVEIPPVNRLVTWVATGLFGFSAPLVTLSGSGDKPFDWAVAASLLAIAGAVTALWSFLDRKKLAHARLHAWTYVFVRLAAGATMIGYGMSKVIPLQMPFPGLTRLLEPYGQFSLMGVLWAHIGSAPAFERFTGVVELTAGILLFIPRVSLLAAMLSLLASSFIFVLNMTYDVPVKLLSLHLVLMSVFLLAPHSARLLNLFVLNRATEPWLEPRLAERPMRRRGIVVAQLVLGALLVLASFSRSVFGYSSYGPGMPQPPLYGIWEITQMAIDGQVRSPLTTDYERWRRAVVPAANALSFQRMDDTFVRYRAAIDTKAHVLTLSKAPPIGIPQANAGGSAGRLTYEQSAADQLVLDGTIEGKRIRMELHRVDHTAFRLLQSRFRWVQDYPYNR